MAQEESSMFVPSYGSADLITLDVISKLVKGILDSITLTQEGTCKMDSYDPDSIVTGTGAITCIAGGLQQKNPGVADFDVTFSIVGLTFSSTDADKKIIRGLFCDVMRSVMGFTAASLTTASGVTVDGIYPIQNAVIQAGSDKFLMNVDFKLALGELSF